MRFIAALVFSASLCISSPAQPRGGPASAGIAAPGALFGGGMAKLFGETPSFTANMQIDAKSPNGPVSIPGKVAFLNGKSRFEMDATKMKGSTMPPAAVEQIRAMGMAEVLSITLPEKKEAYLVYPGLKSYAIVPISESLANSQNKANLAKTELGKETVDGHPTTKYKVIVRSGEAQPQEAIVWMASDLKNFPIKIQTANEGAESVVTFTNVTFTKPDEAQFVPPADFQKYSDAPTMMRDAMMKRFPRPGATPPAAPKP